MDCAPLPLATGMRWPGVIICLWEWRQKAVFLQDIFLFIVAVQRPCFHQSSGDWIYFIHKVSIELCIERGDFLFSFILLFCKTCSNCIFTETCVCKCHVVYFKMLPVDPGDELRSVCSCCHFMKTNYWTSRLSFKHFVKWICFSKEICVSTLSSVNKLSCHVIIHNRLSLYMGSRGVAAGANPSLVSGQGQGTPWTSNVGFSILLKYTSTCSSALPWAGIWTSDLWITSRPALPAELQPPRSTNYSFKFGTNVHYDLCSIAQEGPEVSWRHGAGACRSD